MNKSNTSRFSLVGKFGRVAKLWEQLDKKPRQFGTGEHFSGAEIHLIEVVGQNEDLSVTALAGRLGITKGAVSQTLKRLAAKEIIEKETDPSNTSRVIVNLTTKGKVAFFAHLHWHETMDGGFRNYFMSLSEERIRFLDEFLTILEQFLKRRK
jgi:DNA-binding MarR family transcriptional regulator